MATQDPPGAPGSPADRRPPGRDNGLVAASYVPLAEVDPRLAAAVLERLAAVGVAAYVAPSTGSVGGYLEVRLPARPIDRVFVDAQRRGTARSVLADVLPDLGADGSGGPGGGDPGEDDDATWRALVAAFHRPAEAGTAPWPALEDLDPGPADDPARPADAAGGPSRLAAEPTGPRLRRRQDDEPAADVPVEDEGHYEPPPPEPVPRPAHATLWAVLAVVGGMLALVVPPLLAWEPSELRDALGVLLIGGGVGVLVWRMRDAPPRDSGPDDGAVV